ncbi:MAG: HK97 family phage prohead protease [Thermodesulfobacteriota bacterium]
MGTYKQPVWKRIQNGWMYQEGQPWSIAELFKEEAKSMSGIERKIFSTSIKSVNRGELIVDCCISSEREDRGLDVMVQDGMTIEEGWKPPVLYSHGISDRFSNEAIAKILKLWRGKQDGYPATFAAIQFYDGPEERRLYDKVVNGFMNSFSIGYCVDKFEPTHNGSGRKVTSWRLLELSLVSIPMQIDAHVIESGNFAGLQCKFLNSDPGHKKPTPETIKCYLGKGQVCSLKELPAAIEKRSTEIVRREIRRAMGKID